MLDDFIVTFDIDWAPEFIIDIVADMIRKRGIKSTWFVTHACSAVERLREDADMFELGVHPNFLPGSTHGKTPNEVLSHMLSIVPEAISMRSHSIVQSAPILQSIITQTKLRVDSTFYLPKMPYIQPVEFYHFGGSLLRIPFYWADDYEMGKPNPNWNLEAHGRESGLKVFDFHPIHIYLNSSDTRCYQMLKEKVSDLTRLTPKFANRFVQKGEGTQTFFLKLIDHLARERRSLRLRDIYERYENEWIKN